MMKGVIVGMAKKFTYEEVKTYFSEQGCELLELEYINANTKMKYICICGNPSTITFSKFFHRGQRCRKCADKKNAERQRPLISKIREFIESNNYRLVSKTYTNAHEKIIVVCPENHEYNVTFDAFKRGNRCPKCSGKEKYTFEEVKEIFKSKDCNLLENEYINSNTPMKYVCKCGLKSEISLASLLNGSHCKQCGYSKISESQRKSFQEISTYFKNKNCIIVSYENEYINNSSTLKYVCECGNLTTTTWRSFSKSELSRCKKCGDKRVAENHRNYTKEDIEELFSRLGFTMLSDDYVSHKVPIEFVCSKGHETTMLINSILNSEQCKECSKETNRGNDHHAWNKERSQEDRLIKRQFDGYKDWRNSVFKRDEYICQCCGLTGGIYLHAHHLDNYSEFIDKRLDLENGITLCSDCHSDFHKMYGTKGNTKEQFEEYMTGIAWNHTISLCI
jgi:hypothetical protein